MKNIEDIRADFPILGREVHNRPLIYLDNAATTQLPVPVLDAMEEQYRFYQANIHRGVHYLSEQSTMRVEEVRRKTADLIGASESAEIIFTSGTTESINMVARSFSEGILGPGDVIISTEMEHHSNLIPWQEAARRTGTTLRVIPLTENGELDIEAASRFLKESPRLLVVTAVSNVIGTVNPIRKLISMAHEAGAAVLVDGAQLMRHSRVNVQELDCDFLCFSGHKMMAPGGTGVLYGKRHWLEKLPPASFGGGMVAEVDLERAAWETIPFKFEAGTRNIAGIVGLGAAIDYLNDLGIEDIITREAELLRYAEEILGSRSGIGVLGAPRERAGALSFNINGLSFYDTARLLDQLGIAVRSGHHCAQPLLRHFKLEGAVRLSPAFYNTKEELDAFSAALGRILALSGIGHE